MRMLTTISPYWAWSRRNLSPSLMGDLSEEFDRIAESFSVPSTAVARSFQTSCDINETQDHYLISFDMPGVKREDIKIETHNNELVISGERRERSGKFERTFVLPSTVNIEKIEAHYEDGVLNVALPKHETAKSRTIEIQSGQGGFLSKLLGTKKESTKDLKDVKVS